MAASISPEACATCGSFRVRGWAVPFTTTRGSYRAGCELVAPNTRSSYRVTISTPAQIALHSLQPQDQRQVEERIKQLARFPHDEYVRQQASQLVGYQDVYLVRVSPSLRLIFQASAAGGEVMEIVTQERLRQMSSYAHS